MKKAITMTVVACSMALSGCATILSGDTQKVNVTTSNNKSATAVVDGKSFQVPGTIEVQRKNADMVVKASGNCQGETVAKKDINPVFFVNILTGGPLGSTTDYASESMWKYDDNINIKCK